MKDYEKEYDEYGNESLEYDEYGNPRLDGYQLNPDYHDSVDNTTWIDTGRRTIDGDTIYVNEDGDTMI